MFRTLHKLLGLAIAAIIVAAGVIMFQQRARFSPLVDLAAAANPPENASVQPRDALAGRVIAVLDRATFRLREPKGQLWTVRLDGVDTRNLEALSPEAGAARTNLMELVLSNYVHVDVTTGNYSNSVLGVVYVGQTNVNAALVASGAIRARDEQMNRLTFRERYALIRASRRAP